jgi:hypothetical protein
VAPGGPIGWVPLQNCVCNVLTRKYYVCVYFDSYRQSYRRCGGATAPLQGASRNRLTARLLHHHSASHGTPSPLQPPLRPCKHQVLGSLEPAPLLGLGPSTKALGIPVPGTSPGASVVAAGGAMGVGVLRAASRARGEARPVTVELAPRCTLIDSA